MTDAPVAAGQRKRRALWVILALSLTLNLFFVVGAAWIAMNRPARFASRVAHMRYVAAELHLDAQHKKAFESYLGMLRARLKAMHAEVRPIINEAWAELAKPQATEDGVMRLFDKAAKEHRRFQEKLTRSTLAFLATLTPEQRAKFIELAHRRPRFWSRSVIHRTAPSGAAKPEGASQ